MIVIMTSFLKHVRFFLCMLNTCLFLVPLCCVVIGEEPCSGDPGQLAKYRPCRRGQRLEKSCTQRCVSCDAGTNYQDTFTNCSTCLPCKTAEDCLPGEIIRNCTVDSDTVCGCPPPPPCPVCPPCPTATFCPSVTPCPAQTECPACEYPTYAPVTTEPQPPKLTFIRKCPSDKLAGATSGSRLKNVEWEEPLATDGAKIIQSHHPGESFVVGNTTVIYVFELDSHDIYCSFIVTVTTEKVPPTTPFSRDETTEGSTAAIGFQNNDDWNSCMMCWNLIAIFPGAALLVFIVLIAIIVACCIWCNQTKNQPKDLADPETPQHEVAANKDQEEGIELRRLAILNEPIAADGTEDGSAGTSDAVSNRAPIGKGLQKPPTPAFSAKECPEPDPIIEAGGVSEIRTIETSKSKNGAQEEKPKELSQVTSSPSFPGKYDASQRTFDQSQHIERLESLSYANSMKGTFEYLSENLSEKWQAVGRSLGLEDSTLTHIKNDNNTMLNTIYKMLLEWKQKSGSQATYKKLIQTLEDVGRKDLAESVTYREDLK